MTAQEIEKKIAEYEQQAELMFANYHRLKGAIIALKGILSDWDANTVVDTTDKQ